mmetsp:Transcript_7385/g.16745  ORF Transcript_7385/g.16745 Transcript_7385/m.16745 type:complete len:400 (+) Transcript_7385:49-1248(+)
MTTMKLTPLGKAAFVSFSHHLRNNRQSSAPLFPCSQPSCNHRQGITSSIRLLATMDNNDGMQTSGPALVDVDCNLLHSDLMSVMNSISSLQIDGVEDALKILHHPSTTESNIVAMISPSSTIDESERSVQLLESSTDQQRNKVCVKTTVGVHPYHALEEGRPGPDNLSKIRALLDKPNSKQIISCIGETGLDYSEGFPDKEHQKLWFEAQLDLAFDYNLPIFLHERLAFSDTLQYIDEAIERHAGKPIPKIIVHCYTGSFDECVEYMNRGYYTSISGYINKAGEGCDEVKKCLREGIVPMDRLMLETDAPYMGFAGNKDSFFDAEGDAFTSLSGKRRKRLKSMYPNLPSSLPLVLQTVCDELNYGREARGEAKLSVQELAQVTTENAMNFFGLELDGIK